MLYFLKAWDSRISNMTFQCIKCNIHKYTNTKCLKVPTSAIFFKSIGFKDIKYDIPVCHEDHECHEYKNTKCPNDPFLLYFWNAGGSKKSNMTFCVSWRSWRSWHIIKHNVGASRVSLDHFYLCSVQATFWIQSNNLYDLIKFIFDLMYLIWLQANERLWTFGRFPRVVIQQLEGV